MKAPEKLAPVVQNIKDKIDNLDEKQMYYILIGALVFVFLLDYFILMRPQLGTLNKISPEIKILKEDIEKAKTDIEKESFYRGEISRLQEEVDQANIKLRSKEEVPLILEYISRIADEHDLKIDQIMPDVEAQEVVLEKSEKAYFNLPILIDARSSFHNFGKFINGLENGDIFLTIAAFTVAKSDNDRRLHTIKITLNALVFGNVEEEEKETSQ